MQTIAQKARLKTSRPLSHDAFRDLAWKVALMQMNPDIN